METEAHVRRRRLAIFAMLIGTVLPASTFATALRYTALAYLLINLLISVRAGYRVRRHSWTRESWRRYLRACAIPVGALLLVMALMTVVELRLPIAGAARSTTRVIWIIAIAASLLTPIVGLGIVLSELAEADPSRQFAKKKI